MGGRDKANIRELILECLMEVLEEGTYSHVILNAVLNKYAYLPKQDRAFLTVVFEGTIERLITIDYILDEFSKTPVRKMKPLIRNLLRSAVYQIVYLDKTPDSVIVNESVKLAGKRGFKGLQGFVNGLLRNISRNRSEIRFPEKEGSPVRYLSVKYSVPEWIVTKFLDEFDFPTVEGILEKSLKRPDTVIRINKNTNIDDLKKRMEQNGISMEKTCFSNAFVIKDYDRIADIPGFSNGEFRIQDLSSVRVGNLISEYIDLNGKKVLDVCAAPGGKSLHLLDMGANVTACDLSENKTALIKDNLKQITDQEALKDIMILEKDAAIHDSSFENAFDVVLADVPCSGLGVLGRKADIKYRLAPEDIDSIVKLQSTILDNVSTYVKPGGLFVFSTCTLDPDENEYHRDRIKNSGDFELLKEELRIPGRDLGDGFYITIFRKRTEPD